MKVALTLQSESGVIVTSPGQQQQQQQNPLQHHQQNPQQQQQQQQHPQPDGNLASPLSRVSPSPRLSTGPQPLLARTSTSGARSYQPQAYKPQAYKPQGPTKDDSQASPINEGEVGLLYTISLLFIPLPYLTRVPNQTI
jgi:hypothetical protein